MEKRGLTACRFNDTDYISSHSTDFGKTDECSFSQKNLGEFQKKGVGFYKKVTITILYGECGWG